MTDFAYIALCGLAPLVWAHLGALLFRGLDARRTTPERGKRPPPGDYSI